MKRGLLLAVSLLIAASAAQPATIDYDVVTTWHEPDTQPNDSIFIGSFRYDHETREVSGLTGILSESMTGGSTGHPDDSMTWLTLGHQLVSWYDAALGGTFAATFKNPNTDTFWQDTGGDGWSPEAGIAVGGVHHGFPGSNPGNAYALIFIPDDPLTPLTQQQIDRLAYADCAPGAMMGAVCMTGTSEAGYGAVGTMSGHPVSQQITAVPEPGMLGPLAGGLVLFCFASHRSRQSD